jgi:hypothetical protein
MGLAFPTVSSPKPSILPEVMDISLFNKHGKPQDYSQATNPCLPAVVFF